MKDLRSCIKLNNEAVVLLSSGDSQRALALFQDAVRMVRSALIVATPQPSFPRSTGKQQLKRTSAHHRRHHQRSSNHVVMFQQEPVAIPDSSASAAPNRTSPTTATGVAADHQGGCYVYNHAFRINSLHDDFVVARDNPNMDPDILPTVAALVIFNMALAYHRNAERLSVDSKGNNKEGIPNCAGMRALDLYTKALRLLRDRRAGASGIDISLLRCAALNNRSQLQYEKGEYALAREGLDEVHRMMYHGFASRNHARQLPRLFQQDDLVGLLSNVYFLRTPTLAAAA